MDKYDVSIIVCIYNPDFEKMIRTLKSVVRQRGIKYEVIVSDDGSKESNYDRLNMFFTDNGFEDFIIIESNENRGTVINQYEAMMVASGKYIRGVSPGDFFADDYSVYKFFRYAENNKAVICFGDLIYYDSDNSGRMRTLRKINSPRHPELYEDTGKNARAIDENYLVFNESISGASFFYKRDITLKYLALLKNRVKFTEDQVFRLMAVDGIRPLHMPELVMFYEFGTGISTGKDCYWDKMIKDDIRTIREIIRGYISNNSFFYRRFKFSLKFCNYPFLYKAVRVFFFPRGAFRELIYMINPRYTQTVVGESDGEM